MPYHSDIPKNFPRGWISVSFDRETKEIIWQERKGFSLTEPFYENSLRKLKAEKRQTFSCSMGKIEEISCRLPTSEAIVPTAFIFHISRCGSTLFSQILAQSPENSVFSEPRFMDEVLGSTLNEGEKCRLVQNLVQLMGKSDAEEKHLFIKWDSWHVYYFDFLRKAFPDVPMVFLYRNPVEVLCSHQKFRGMQMVPGMLDPDIFKIKEVPCYDLDLYTALVLKKIMEKMVLAKGSKVWVVNYDQLPEAVFALLREWGLDYNEKELASMRARIKFHSKSKEVFEAENRTQNETGDRLEKLAEDHLKKPYLKLEFMNDLQKQHENNKT